MNKYDDTDYLIEREESIKYEEKAKRQTENTINYYKNIEKNRRSTNRHIKSDVQRRYSRTKTR